MLLRAVILLVAVLWLALMTPTAHAMDEPRNDVTLIAQTQPRLSAVDQSVQPLRSAPAEASSGQKESNPLSVIIPVVLVGVWAGMGIMMFRRARHDQSTRNRPD